MCRSSICTRTWRRWFWMVVAVVREPLSIQYPSCLFIPLLYSIFDVDVMSTFAVFFLCPSIFSLALSWLLSLSLSSCLFFYLALARINVLRLHSSSFVTTSPDNTSVHKFVNLFNCCHVLVVLSFFEIQMSFSFLNIVVMFI